MCRSKLNVYSYGWWQTLFVKETRSAPCSTRNRITSCLYKDPTRHGKDAVTGQNPTLKFHFTGRTLIQFRKSFICAVSLSSWSWNIGSSSTKLPHEKALQPLYARQELSSGEVFQLTCGSPVVLLR
ncbi:uncharacterized protein LOC135198163 isoform X1 [Macrobrachium nipponense]|uniref:uncharacterized protein LOC135198163 isoform X1 n=1 Tax=Macrobrachium nipponense TaxID=159736 RepID=UPI0030C7FE84